MKFTLSWLQDHLDTAADVKTIADTLTRIGLEVERLHDPAAALVGFVIAAVTEAGPHPNADRLRVCAVDTGIGSPVQVVCGAPNARTGMRSVFSPVGTYIPGKNITLAAGVIRGVESNGMLCSAAELGLGEDHDGILDLPADAPVGTTYAAWAGLDDPVIEINLTPNRPDAMGVLGIARDLAAAGVGTMRAAEPAAVAAQGSCTVAARIDLAAADAHLAPAFALRSIAGVTNGASPEWLQRRLRAVGLRPINALVDVTNFLSLDRARPLHVFDAAKLRGDLHVRRGRDGETLLALDGKTYEIDSEMIVVADDSGPVSLAGIMGGAATGCDESTTTVVVESALWDAATIARTGRRLGINSDARYRFERGVDPASTLPGLDRATAMMVALCGGVPSAITAAGAVPNPQLTIAFPLTEVRRLSGLDLPAAEIVIILERLGFAVAMRGEGATTIDVGVPSFRPDVTGKADLVEEVVRIVGVDRVEPQPLAMGEPGTARALLTLLQQRTRRAKRALAASGLVEAVTWSFIPGKAAELFADGRKPLHLANPIAADLSHMRPSLLPGLVAAAARNGARGYADVALFEVGQVFHGLGETEQRMAAAAIRVGTATANGAGRHWSGPASPAGAYDVKADSLALLDALGVPTGGLQVVPGATSAFHPGRSMTFRFGPQNVVGYAGELHPGVLAALDAPAGIAALELFLDGLPAAKARPTKAKPKLDLSDFMPVSRDFAFIVDRTVAAGDIVKAARSADRALVSDVSVFDIYEGRGVAEGAKSVAIAVTLQPREKTLTDVEIDSVSARIVADVGKKTGAVLRG